MEIVNEIELSIAKEIINIGFAKSADSLSFFLREKVLIRNIFFDVRKVSQVESFSSKICDDCVVLTTEMIGDIKGICYLVFSSDEVDKLLNVSLPPDILNDPQKRESMSEAVLLEVDNIITAAVVTQFSNLLKYKVYGAVPHHQTIKYDEISDLIRGKADKESFLINFKAEFHSGNLNFNPEFIWMLDESFIEGVKKFAREDENLKKLNSIKEDTYKDK